MECKDCKGKECCVEGEDMKGCTCVCEKCGEEMDCKSGECCEDLTCPNCGLPLVVKDD